MYAHNPFGYSDPSLADSPSPFGEFQFSDLDASPACSITTSPWGCLFVSAWTIPTAPDNEFNF
jgi:hypothetical protein